MKIKSFTFPVSTLIAIFFICILVACQAQKASNVAAQLTATLTQQSPGKPQKSPSPSKNENLFVHEFNTDAPIPTGTNTPIPHTPTEVAVLQSSFSSIGTPIPKPNEPINVDNYQRLAKVAQWGNGKILGVLFTPDGKSFVIGTGLGYAIYSINDPDNPPQWIPFDTPFFYNDMFFSQDGKYIRFDLMYEGELNSRNVHNFSSGELITPPEDVIWQELTTSSHYNGTVSATSPDGSKRMENGMVTATYLNKGETWEKNYISVTGLYNSYTSEFIYTIPDLEGFYSPRHITDISSREMYDNVTGELLYKLNDKSFFVYYSDRNEPEGCDLDTHSVCENAFEASTFHPYRVGFSPSGNGFAILYRLPLNFINKFSILRVYCQSDGKLLNIFGELKNPVESFAYSMDGKKLLIGFVNGVVELWDLENNTEIYKARDFSDTVEKLNYTMDSKYLVIQRSDSVEIRLMNDGSLRAQFPATTYAISPVENLVAIGESDGKLLLFDIEEGETRFQIQAHRAEIYALSFSPDGQSITSSGQDCVIRNWDTATGKFNHYFEESITDAYDQDGTASRIFIYKMLNIPGVNQLIGFGSWSRIVGWNADTGETQFLIEPDDSTNDHYQYTINTRFPQFSKVDFSNYMGYDLIGERKIDQSQFSYDLSNFDPWRIQLSKDGKLKFDWEYDQDVGQVHIENSKTKEIITRIDIQPEYKNLFLTNEDIHLSPNGDQLLVFTDTGVIYIFQVVPES